MATERILCLHFQRELTYSVAFEARTKTLLFFTKRYIMQRAGLLLQQIGLCVLNISLLESQYGIKEN
jgi:hypothetical protein